MAHHSLRTITATEMRSVNRSAVLDHISRNSPVARSVIARVLKLSLPTVIRIVDELVSASWVRPAGKKEWSSERRRDLLENNKEGHAVVGIDLGGTKIVGARPRWDCRMDAQFELARLSVETRCWDAARR